MLPEPGRPHRRIILVCAASAAVALSGLLGGSAGAATPISGAGTAQEVILNPTTGAVVSVTPLTKAQYQALEQSAGEVAVGGGALPEISNSDYCDSGWACYYTNQAPYADQGFYGSSGTYHGDWPDRSGFDTGDYSAYACWVGGCSSTWPPNTYVGFTSDVTGTAFWIN